MTTTTHPSPAAHRAPRVGRMIGLAGVVLGVGAGLTQLLAGSAIPQWSGDKLDTTGLGITTIILSLVAAVGLAQLHRELPRWERFAVLLLVLACAGVCFTTVGRLWYIPGPLLIAAAVLAFATVPAKAVEEDVTQERLIPSPGVGAWLLYAVAVVLGLVLAISSLLTVLLGAHAPSVAAAAAVALVAGLAVSAGVAPLLRRRAPAMFVGGFGAGLMAGGVVLGASAVMIAMG